MTRPPLTESCFIYHFTVFFSFAIGRLAPFVQKPFFRVSLLLFFFAVFLSLPFVPFRLSSILLASIILLLIAFPGHCSFVLLLFIELSLFCFSFRKWNIISRRQTTYRKIHEIHAQDCIAFVLNPYIFILLHSTIMWNILLNVCA